MTFAELKADILALIGRAPANACYRLLTADINNSLRLRAMEASVALVEAATVTLPADFLAVVSLIRDVEPRTTLRPTTPQALHAGFRSSGTPGQYAIVDGALLLSPAPDGTANLRLRYYAKVADLVNDGDTNDVMSAHPGIYIYGALKHHATLLRDPEAAAIWTGEYNAARAQAGVADLSDKYSGAPLSPYVGSVA